MNRIFIILLMVTSFFAISDSYKYELKNKVGSKNMDVPEELINKYHGWYHSKNGPFTLVLNYPSMKEGNYKNEKWLSLSIQSYEKGRYSQVIGNGIVDSRYKGGYCGLNVFKKYELVGEKLGFDEYIYHSRTSPEVYSMYIPVSGQKGIHCIRCLKDKTCTGYMVSENDIDFHVTSPMDKFLNNWEEVYGRSNKLISKMVVE